MADGSITIDTSLDNSGIEKGLKQMGTLAKHGAAVSAKAFAVLQGAIVAVGGYALKVGDDYKKALNQIQASTGATAQEMQGLSDTVKTVYSAGMGESMEDVANAIQNVQKNIGGTKEEIEQATKSAIGFRDTFGYEVEESTRAAKAMMDNFGISAEQAYNLMAQGAQNGLDYSGEMIDNINEYSVQFAKLGLDAEDMFNIFQSGAENGAWNLDKIGDAIKEFSIRAIDGSKTTIEGFEKIGMNADEMAQKFASGGEVARDAFYEVIQALGEMEDPVEQSIAGVDLFGTMWEDLGPTVVTQLGSIQNAYDVTKDTMEEINNIKFNDVESALKSIKRNVETAILIPVSEKAMPLVNEFAQETIKSIKRISDAFEKDGFEGLSTAVGEELAKGLSELAKAAPDFVEIGVDVTKSFVKGLLASADDIADAGVDMIGTLARALLGESMGEDVEEFAENVKDTFFTLAEAGKKAIGELQPLLSNIASILLDVAGTALPLAAKAVSLLASNSKILATALLAVGGGIGALKAFQKVSGVVSAVTSSFQTAALAARTFGAGMSSSLTAGQAAVGLLSGRLGAATTATTVFQSAIAALGGPVGALALAVTAGVIAYSLATEKNESALEKNKKALKEFNAELEEEKKIRENIAERKENYLNDSMTEIDNTERLISELEKLVDANGKVLEGEEAKAKALSDQINKTIPDAISLAEDENGAYLKIADSIDLVIKKKRINALIDANQETYTNALKDYEGAVNSVREAEEKLKDAEKNLQDARNADLSSYTAQHHLQEAQAAYDEWTEKLKEAKENYVKITDDIIGQEELMAAAQSENAEVIEEALAKETASIKIYGAEQLEEAEKQYQEKKEYAETTKKLYEEYGDEYTRIQYEKAKEAEASAKKVLDDAKKEREESIKQAGEIAVKIIHGNATNMIKTLSDTLFNGKGEVEETAKDVASAVPEAVKTTLPEMKAAAAFVIDGFILIVARIPPLLKWGMNCGPTQLTNSKIYDTIQSVEINKRTDTKCN